LADETSSSCVSDVSPVSPNRQRSLISHPRARFEGVFAGVAWLKGNSDAMPHQPSARRERLRSRNFITPDAARLGLNPLRKTPLHMCPGRPASFPSARPMVRRNLAPETLNLRAPVTPHAPARVSLPTRERVLRTPRIASRHALAATGLPATQS